MKTNHASTNRSHPEGGQYALHRGPDGWELTFEGQRATFKHEPGASYVACLLLHPPRKPIHALALAPEARTLSGPTPSATEVIQQRYLGLDETEGARNLRRRERELEAVLDDDEEIEPVKAEALRELEAIADFIRKHPWRSRECVQKCARAVSLAIRCLHARLAVAVDAEGQAGPGVAGVCPASERAPAYSLGRGRHPGPVPVGRCSPRLVHLRAAGRCSLESKV